MKDINYFGNWKKIQGVSYGIVYLLFIMWVIFNLHKFVPSDQQELYFAVFVPYAILNVIIIGSADMRNKLFNVKLIEFLPRLILYTFIFLTLFYFVFARSANDPNSLFGLLGGLPLWLILSQAFIFATTESILWQGYLDDLLGRPFSAISAGVFHMFIWQGEWWFIIVSAGLLFAFFTVVHLFLRKNKNDFAPVIGCHLAYNLIKLGLFVSAGGFI